MQTVTAGGNDAMAAGVTLHMTWADEVDESIRDRGMRARFEIETAERNGRRGRRMHEWPRCVVANGRDQKAIEALGDGRPNGARKPMVARVGEERELLPGQGV